MNKALALLTIGFLLGGCTGSVSSTGSGTLGSGSDIINLSDGSTSTATELQITQATIPSTFQLTSFSSVEDGNHIYLDSTNDKILLGWNFFPDEHDFDSNSMVLTLPCESTYEYETEWGVNVSVSVPLTDEPCEDTIAIDVSSADAEAYGLIFDFSGEFELFDDDLGFKITTSGFETSSGTTISIGSTEEATMLQVVSNF